MAKPVSIVLVDDDPDEHLLFREDLTDAGVLLDFQAFTRADEALEHLRQRDIHPVLILTDLSLAADAALTLIEDCQAYLHGGAIGCYSGTLNPEMDELCRERGTSFYIVKPVTREIMLQVVETLKGITVEEHDDGKVSFVAE
ncbi:MAG: response regulator [Alphaproteobacteria bacterium]|nr:response regulator [Alphaproteobacteria bacterium]